MTKLYSLYSAGPYVFSPDADKIVQEMKDIGERYGFVVNCPSDNEVDFSKPKEIVSKEIFDKNIALMNQSDIYVGDLESWRGIEPDSGTVWESSYFYSSGKPCYGYLFSYPKTYVQKMNGLCYKDDDGWHKDYNGYKIERFNAPLNCMLMHSVDKLFQSFEQCLAYLKEEYY